STATGISGVSARARAGLAVITLADRVPGRNDMGWAKYQEDIVSRWVNDNQARRAPRADATPTQRKGTAIPKQEKHMSKLKEFTMSSARPLPVIVLADVSGSMSANGKIDALNDAVSEMIATFAEEDDTRA